MEGWAQDPKCGAINVGRLLGMADSLRAVAVVAGPKSRPARGSLLLNAPRLRPTLRRDPCEESGGGARIRAAPRSISNPLLVNEFCPGSLTRTAVIATDFAPF